MFTEPQRFAQHASQTVPPADVQKAPGTSVPSGSASVDSRRAPASALLLTGLFLAVGGFLWAAFDTPPNQQQAQALSAKDALTEEAAAPESLGFLPALLGDTSILDRLTRPPETDLNLVADDWLRRGDTVETLLTRLGVEDSDFLAWARQSAEVREAFASNRSTRATVRYLPDIGVQSLTLRWPDTKSAGHFLRLTIKAAGDSDDVNAEVSQASRFAATTESVPYKTSARLASGVIESSLFATTDAANIPDSIAMGMAEIFSNDIDFNRDLRKGDTFAVVYEILEADNEALETGRILAASFTNKGTRLNAIWFEQNGRGDYYDLNGVSTRRFYLASPMEFSRVTSSFSKRRFHPVLKINRPHLGVDYGAPTGTPVRTVGDGRVVFAGRRGGYGNVIEIRHDSQSTTVYAHLSRIFVKRGQRVERGERIGAVGSTGVSTGPHLHFEHRVNGVHKDPSQMAKNSRATQIDRKQMAAFQAIADTATSQLAAARQVHLASAE